MVDVDGRGERTSPDRTVAALGPTDDHVSSHHPIVGHPDSIAQQLFAAVGGPTRQARTQALGAGGQHEVLSEQHRREFGGPIVGLVGGPVVTGTRAVVLGIHRFVGEAPDRPGGGHHFPHVAAWSPHAHEPTAHPRNDSVTIQITII
jgi:hypothetical protein